MSEGKFFGLRLRHDLFSASSRLATGRPSFTPDGSRIVFLRFDGVDEAFWSMDLIGNDRQRIGPCCPDPNVSPKGEKLSFVVESDRPFEAALFTSNIDGSNLVPGRPPSVSVSRSNRTGRLTASTVSLRKMESVIPPESRQTLRPSVQSERTRVS
jgi:WD40-like Beta Propeller Repeat